MSPLTTASAGLRFPAAPTPTLRAAGCRPPLHRPAAASARELTSRRAAINRAAFAGHPDGPLPVVLYALIRPGGAPHDNLAIAQGYAEAHRLHVVERIVDVLDHADHAGADDPCLRRGYARALHLLADSASRARGIVAVSRSSVTTASHPYEAQLLWHADHKTGLFLVRSEVEI